MPGTAGAVQSLARWEDSSRNPEGRAKQAEEDPSDKVGRGRSGQGHLGSGSVLTKCLTAEPEEVSGVNRLNEEERMWQDLLLNLDKKVFLFIPKDIA